MMNPAYTTDEARIDLLRRAEQLLARIGVLADTIGPVNTGEVREWLRDYERLELREASDNRFLEAFSRKRGRS